MEKLKKRFNIFCYGLIILAVLAVALFLVMFIFAEEASGNTIYLRIVSGIAIIIFLGIGLFYTKRLKRGWKVKINKFLEANPEVKWEELEKDFDRSTAIKGRLYIGEKYLYFMENDGFPNIIYRKKLVNYRYELIGMKNSKYYIILSTDKDNEYFVWVKSRKEAERAMPLLSLS